MAGFIDSHFHISSMQRMKLPVAQILEALFHQGFAGGLDVGLEIGDIETRSAVLAPYPSIGLTVGLYPGYAERIARGERLQDFLDRLEKEILRFSPAAVGETGLDRHWNYGTSALQHELVVSQIELANRYRLPIIVHNREADRDIAELLSAHPADQAGIIHCFSSERTTAFRLLDLGFCISFAGNITYKRNGSLREVLAAVPSGRLLLETDSPYLSPEPMRGRPNTPEHITHIYRTAAESRRTAVERLAEEIENNFFTRFERLKRNVTLPTAPGRSLISGPARPRS